MLRIGEGRSTGRKPCPSATFVCFWHDSPPVGRILLINEASRSHIRASYWVELLWTSDQLVAETFTWQHTTLATDKHPCSRLGFEPTFSAGERPQIYALDREVTGTGRMLLYSPQISHGLAWDRTRDADVRVQFEVHLKIQLVPRNKYSTFLL